MNRNPPSPLLIRALWEDVLLLLFVGIIALSGLEAFLPEIVLSRMPLALIFFVFFGMLLGYLSLYKELPLSVLVTPPLWLKIVLGVVIFFILLMSLRGFGLVGALIQIALLAALWFLTIKKG